MFMVNGCCLWFIVNALWSCISLFYFFLHQLYFNVHFHCSLFYCMCSKARVCVYVWKSSVSEHFCSLLLQVRSKSVVIHFYGFCRLFPPLSTPVVFFPVASESLICVFSYFGGLLWCRAAIFIPPDHSTRSANLIDVAKGTSKTFSLFLLVGEVFVHFIL